MNRIVIVAFLQLTIMNHRLIILDDEVQARRRRRGWAKDSWPDLGQLLTECYNLVTMSNLWES